MEGRAFYADAPELDAKHLRELTQPEWTVAAFDNGVPIADVRAIPRERLMNGAQTPFAIVGPVACAAPYRRQGHAGKLLKMSFELMRERGQPITGLYTPHDALYRRYGYERSEEKRRLTFAPKAVRLRWRASGGKIVPGTPDDWARINEIYMAKVEQLNGPLTRGERWWRFSVLRDFAEGKPKNREIVIWVDEAGSDRGYAAYQNRPTGDKAGGWDQQEVFIRDLVALDSNAYLGLWEHMQTHDLAARIVHVAHPKDPFQDMCEDPFVVKAERDEGPMIRIVDIEKALETRPYVGNGTPSFTMRIADRSAPWNDGTWKVEAGDGKMRAAQTTADPDIEMDVNFLAPLYTGFRTPQLLANVGMITVHNANALPAITDAFSATATPYTYDFY